MTQTATPPHHDLDPHWQTRLFAPATDDPRPTPQDRLSPRAAYQMLLYRRATLLDLRTLEQRRTHGEIAAELRSTADTDGPVVVLCHDGRASSTVAQAMRASGHHRVGAIEGGFRAWRTLGLPT